MKKLNIINPCSDVSREYIYFLIKTIMSDNFSAKKNQYVIPSLLNACSGFIIENIYNLNAQNNPVIILKLLKEQHEVFNKISYLSFYKWFNKFVKNLEKNKSCCNDYLEFFQKNNSIKKLIDQNESVVMNSDDEVNRIIDVTPKTASTDRIADMLVVRPALNDAVAVLDLPEKIDPYQDLLKIGVPAPKLPLTPLTTDDPKFPFYFREGDEVTGLFYDANGIIFDKFTSNEESKMLPVTKNLKFVLELEGENICWNYDYQQFSSIFTKTYTSSDLLEFYRTKNRSYIMSNSDCFHKI